MSEQKGEYTAKTEIRDLDYDSKIKMLETIAQQILDLQICFAKISGEYAEIKANLEVLKQVKSAIQSALRAERDGI